MTSIEATNVPLPKPLRTQLENTVKAARDVAEKAGKAALAQLAVNEAKAPDYLSAEQKALRRSLRAHGRALGDVKHIDDTQGLQHLIWEVSYEHWHRMLFARFLAESGLLMWEPGAAVSLDDCRDMVDNHPDMAMGAKSHWELAGKLAARMLPQVFKPQSPVFELSFAPEDQRALEKLLANLPAEVFQASDSLGWVYQFWQAQRKEDINKSEVKIGADELPAVTQLFTEPYMVDFLLHNSLGAWWSTRHPGEACPVPMPYLRTLEDGTPAAGKFEGWPGTLKDFKLLDPSCGSGHFLVAAFLLLVPLRMADEGLTALDAVDFVLQDNLHGLEIDPRCVEIAVFALALAAWRYPDEDGNPLGVRADMPAPRIACCGLKVDARSDDWQALVPDNHPQAPAMRAGLAQLHSTFVQAPLLGSLLDPRKTYRADMFAADYHALQTLLAEALAREASTLTNVTATTDDFPADGVWYTALAAQGLLEAARLLDARYHLVVTNVPYLTRGKQSDALKEYCEQHFPTAKNDLSTVFIERCYELCSARGILCVVSPQNWWFLKSYSQFRNWLLKNSTLKIMAAIGEEAWEYFGDRGPLATLLIAVRSYPSTESLISGFDTFKLKSLDEKKEALRSGQVLDLSQISQLRNADARLSLEELSSISTLGDYGKCIQGILPADRGRLVRVFWEIADIPKEISFFQGSDETTHVANGRHQIFKFSLFKEIFNEIGGRFQGIKAFGKIGVSISKMRELPVTLYSGQPYDGNAHAYVLKDTNHLPAVWTFMSSTDFSEATRKLDLKLDVTNAVIDRVPFDLVHWQQVAAERYPHGLPKPYSDDPTQWLFHGHPQPATDPLQVAVARLLGYVWPAETDENMELSDEARNWIARCAPLAKHADDDGIVCLQPVRGEQPAHERLLSLLIDAWETVTPGNWTPSVLEKLLAQADCAGKGLAVWLREQFFEQHAKRFHHRPFIWHVWDGQKDGFGALVNYHKLDAKNLERLIHTYLGDWIRTQEAGVASGTDGAPLRLSAAQNLKTRLQAILDGEKPYDIFVRWKPLAEQPIGWNPDLNDGVRLNIRPFMTAEVLRHNKKPKLNITWDKDRGKDVESAPWFKVFGGERINDHHLTLAEKRAARAK